MASPELRDVICAHPGGLHRLAYWEWGDRRNPDVVLCVHGLTRSGRDFDALAERLSARYRVVCPDMPGRGRSQWLDDPNLYAVPQYVADCVTLIARLDVERLDWVGTSMGGNIGMVMAALPGNAVRRLVLNDVGPVLDGAGLGRIGAYAGSRVPDFDSFEEGERVLRERTAEFGPHTDEQFRLLSRHYVVERNGRWTFHYDPDIAVPLKALLAAPMPAMWGFYDAIACPTLVVRGADSDLLSHETAQRMTQRGPRARLVEVPGVGHAPTFIADDQIRIVENFLNEEQAR